MTESLFQDVEVERYELREQPPYVFHTDRREFLQVLGAGLTLVATTDPLRGQRRGRFARREEPLTQRFHLGEDGIVTVFTGKVEVGQGARTQIAQAAAEEFRLPVDRIRVVMADTQRCPDDGGTAGSRTTPSTVPRVRNAAAAARKLLIRHAAERLNVEPAQLTVEDGEFRAAQGGQVTLAELVADNALRNKLDSTAPLSDQELTPVEQWRVLGTSVSKLDGADVVTGTTRYPSDIVRPKMLYGKILRPMAFGATLEAIDLEPAQSVDGVTVVRDGEFVGFAAPTSWQAQQALESAAQTARWNSPERSASGSDVSSDTLSAYFKRTARDGRSRANRWGDLEQALQSAKHTIETEYTIAYIQHAPLEPRAAVAEWDRGLLTVWTGTQQPSRVHSQLRDAFRLRDEQVRVIVPDTGGGFGGKHTGEVAVEAARLARAAGQPVQVRWTREEEFTWAYFRPAGLITVTAGLDEAGRLAAWDFANYNSGGSAIETPYRVPSGRTRFVETDFPLRQGSYRALASTANTFARESAMDELAERAGLDPLQFRLRHLEGGRLKDVLQAAADKFAWSRRSTQRETNRGVGLACGTEKGSFVAACAEVEVVDTSIRVLRVCQAFECGAIQNPGNLRAQVQGCLIMGLGGALSEQIEFADGAISNPSFSGYRVPRMDDVPELDLVFLDRHDLPSVGAGETPIIAVAPAIANAVAQATGVRVRAMPMRLT